MTKYEIIKSGKGCAQVFLAVDCSYGMRTTKVNINGEEKTRLQIAADSAKKLINTLLDSGENIYVGLVFFSGTSYRARGLTQNKQILNKDLDYIVSNNWQTPNTNIVGALDKVRASFENNARDDSNRTLILLSDGIPTSNGNIEVYCDETEEETLYKLYNQIAPSTKDKVRALKEDGIRVVSLFAKSDDNEENQMVTDIFKEDSDLFFSIQDGQETINAITKDIKEYLFITTQEKEYTEENTVLAGCEDEDRRKEVDNNFNGTFYYKNGENGNIKTSIFKQIDKYDSEEEAKELSRLTYMTVMGGSNYEIKFNPHTNGYKEQIGTQLNSSGKEIPVYKVYQSSGYGGQDLVLAQRPAISLKTTITTTGAQFILPNGQVLEEHKRDVNSDIPIVESIDDEIAQGSVVKVEYTICIKNNSSVQCNYLELIDYLPSNFTYADDSKLITEDRTNKEFGWQQVDLEELLNNGYITQNTYDTYNDRKALKLILDNKGQGSNGFYIPPGGEFFAKIVTSRLISRLDDIGVDNYNVAEILGYRDNDNRRMAYKRNYNIRGNSTLLTKLNGVYPGDSKDEDFFMNTNKVYFLPPTGNKNSYSSGVLK